MSVVKNRENPWTAYWQSGAKASFLNAQANLQHYQMRKFWFERMDELDAKQPIVDIGTGNGVVPQWLSEYAEEKGKKLDVIGIDSAEIKPTNEKLKLKGETAYEDFALPSNKKIGTVVSHFGIEYGDMTSGLANLHKQLKRGGALVALVHSDDSIIVQTSKRVHDLLPSLIKQLKKSVEPLYTSILSLQGKPLPKNAAQAQQKLNQFARKHQNDPVFRRTNFVPAVKHVLQAAEQGKAQESHKVFSDYLNGLTSHRAQLNTMMRAVEQLGDESSVKAKVEGAGFKNVSVQTVQFPETGVVGYCIQATK